MAIANVPSPQKQQNLDEFDVLRRRAKKQGIQAAQQSSDALQRRFASQGMLGSGSAIKAEQLARQEANRQTQESLQGVDLAEAQEKQRRAELEQARQYQTSEREAGQQFQKGMFDSEMSFKRDVFGAEQYWKQLDNDFRDREFAENLNTNFINTITALQNAGLLSYHNADTIFDTYDKKTGGNLSFSRDKTYDNADPFLRVVAGQVIPKFQYNY